MVSSPCFLVASSLHTPLLVDVSSEIDVRSPEPGLVQQVQCLSPPPFTFTGADHSIEADQVGRNRKVEQGLFGTRVSAGKIVCEGDTRPHDPLNIKIETNTFTF